MNSYSIAFSLFFGEVIVNWNDRHLLHCRLVPASAGRGFAGVVQPMNPDDLLGRSIQDWLLGYDRGRFAPMELPLALHEVPTFSARVLMTVARIPLGEVRTYREVAIALGIPRHFRAVGQVMARNRWPLLIPCHRVVGSNGPGGYGPGLDLKERLLRHEGCAWPWN